MFSVTIKRIAELENTLGKALARVLVSTVRGEKSSLLKRLPAFIYFHETKPQFHLGDGDVLTAYAVDLNGQKIIGSHFCGSYDTILNHASEQLSEGYSPKDGFAVIFVRTYYNGRNFSWSLTVVTPNTTKFLPQEVK